MVYDPRATAYTLAGHQEIEAKKAYTGALLHEALVKFGITDGRLDQRRLRDSAVAIAEYVEKRLLGDEAGRADVDSKNPFSFDRGHIETLNGYQRATYLQRNLAFSRKALMESIRDEGLTGVTILNRQIPSLFQIVDFEHRANKTYDIIDPSDLEAAARDLQEKYGVVFDPSLVNDQTRITNLIGQDRDGGLSERVLDETPGVSSSRIVRAGAELPRSEGGIILPRRS